MGQLKVSVCMITYNHAKYIIQAIDGVLMQETNFEIELVIANDCSHDNTDEIVNRYIDAHPKAHCIRYYSHKSNMGMLPNFMFAVQQCKGEYIAICEGDDYWIDPLKLQKEVDFLDANPDYGLIHTNFEMNVNGKTIIAKNNEKTPTGFVFKELLLSSFVTTLTVCIRRNLLSEWMNKIIGKAIDKKWKMGDYPLWLEGALETKYAYLPDITAYYRILPESASHTSDKRKQFEFVKSTFEIREFFMNRENVDADIKNKVKCWFYFNMLKHCVSIGDKMQAMEAYSFFRNNSCNPPTRKMQVSYWAAQYGVFWYAIQIARKMGVVKLLKGLL